MNLRLVLLKVAGYDEMLFYFSKDKYANKSSKDLKKIIDYIMENDDAELDPIDDVENKIENKAENISPTASRYIYLTITLPQDTAKKSLYYEVNGNKMFLFDLPTQ